MDAHTKKGDSAGRYLSCWSCHTPLSPEDVRRDGFIQSRKEKHGGPSYLYRCPRCKAKNLCEITRTGHFFASPPYRPTLADWLLEKLGQGPPAEEFLTISAWFEREEEKRRFLFERDGDLRYSSFGDRLRSFFSRRRKAPDREAPQERERFEHEAIRTPHSIPSPWAILGVPPGSSDAEIKQAFYSLIRTYHPDKAHHLGSEKVRHAEARFKELLKAYEQLTTERPS